MQLSSANRRALNLLASKLHPQLPLSPRESAQLLNLLTTSFRAHLDREHPVELSANKRGRQSLPPTAHNLHNNSSSHPVSSHSSTSQHIESILTNPLFAVRPRRASDPSNAYAELLRNPLGWFRRQIALGIADIGAAEKCLLMLTKDSQNSSSTRPRSNRQEYRPGTQIAEWLRTSSLDTSLEFYSNTQLVNNLIPLLLEEGQEHYLWQWLERPTPKGVEASMMKSVKSFKSNLFTKFMASKLARLPGLDEAIAVFQRAHRTTKSSTNEAQMSLVHSAGIKLINYIATNPQLPVYTEAYEAFLDSVELWGGRWRRAFEATLWLHHPSKPTAVPGLEFMKKPEGAPLLLETAGRAQTRFMIQLFLGVANQSLKEERFSDAQDALQLTKDFVPELITSDNPNSPVSQHKSEKHTTRHFTRKEEDESLAMLDRYIPT